eukprot:jgi/Psemu1/283367/fgenesh1_pg.26_\
MVIADVLCAVNLAASVMVNGICCYYQMNEQNERRKQEEKAIRNVIRTELNIHKRKEMIVKRKELIEAHNEAVGSRLIDERRRKLMALKANRIAETSNSFDREQPMECEQLDASAVQTIHPSIIQTDSFSSTIVNSDIVPTLETKPTTIVLALSRTSFEMRGKEQRNNIFMSKTTTNKTSSLFDDSLEENERDFEEIKIE